MRFADPQILWLLLAVPLVAVLGWWARSARSRALRRFADGRDSAKAFANSVCVHRRAIKLLLLYAAWAAIVFTAARPQWGSRMEEVMRAGVDVAIVVDRSLSMAAEDLAPNRLSHALHAVDRLVDSLPGDRIALVTFAGKATLACPLTLDHGAVRLFLEAVQVEADVIPGTALADALDRASRALRESDRAESDRGAAIVLVTDGEDHEGRVEDIVSRLRAEGIPVFAIGCGTAAGAPIPVRDAAGVLAGYKKDREGRVVTTRLDERVLEDLALSTEGRYYRATATELEIDEIARAIGSMEAKEFGSVLRARYEERFQIPLLIGFFALVAETLLGDRRRNRTRVEDEA